MATKEKIFSLLSDGKPRTVEEICTILDIDRETYKGCRQALIAEGRFAEGWIEPNKISAVPKGKGLVIWTEEQIKSNLPARLHTPPKRDREVDFKIERDNFLDREKARHKLGKLNGQRLRFTGTVGRFGFKPAFKGPDLRTVLIKDIHPVGSNDIVTDHIWLTCGKWSTKLKEGDKVAFDARVQEDTKGYKGHRDDIYDAPIQDDFKLTRPTKVKIVKKGETAQNALHTL